ncbi:BTAD domain-containing putative transcriptional regulator [Actinocorallia sp. A-T 12471]|uniref:BTAD domain-containing putative transcriptional regulator n=1 Tax=Actinocorallia sp. A-T 12471 TaxID=3089813 RepID=UPI0029D05E40|nr:BTAD domain-containing putative transcriptional regulator [Actinocorallia sp. A-T 12471]MDX6742010.1 BTAD domain-containing putative transcriptional regulator [Actinocorallia sp. A-T 12471]
MNGPLTAERERAVGKDRASAALWAVDLLGPLEARRAGLPVELPPRRRSVLALLALRAGTLVTDDGLVDALWGRDAPQTAVRTLHSHIAKLGAALSTDGARLIRRRGPGYLLEADTVRVDRVGFESLTSDGLRYLAQGRCAEAARALTGALALWRGDPLSDAPVHEWALTEVDYLRGLRLQAGEGLFAARLVAGPHAAAAVAEIERLVAEEPLRERLWELLIVALHLGGRTGDALDAYQRARRRLVDELGIDPGEGLRHVEEGVLRGSADARALLRLAPEAARVRGQGPTGPLSLPQQVSALVGREADLAETAGLLRAARLVTLTGFGGTGKSRLAVAAAREAAPEFSEVVFLDVAGLADESVLDAVAAALGVPAHGPDPVLDRIARRVAYDHVLLVLDDCERLAGACALAVRELLGRCPHLRVLATSQEALRVPGEALKPVAPLRFPNPALVRTGADLAGYAAADLFAERARLGCLEALAAPDARAVAEICARCHGLPLALELAAARPLGLTELADLLRDPFAVLDGGRFGARPHHRALRETAEWSYLLLSPRERRALRALSVFGGAFTLDDVAAVHVETPALELVTRLADRSLLTSARTEGGTRYELVDAVRRYAAERLAARPDERRQARRDHASRYRSRAEEIERHLRGPRLGALMTEIAARHDDVRAALDWLTRDDPEGALRLAASLWRYHEMRGGAVEGVRWLDGVLAASPRDVAATARAKALWASAKLTALGGGYGDAVGKAEQALDLFRREHDDAGTARALALLGKIAAERGDYERALEFGRGSRDTAVRCGDGRAVGHALRLLGSASWLAGDPASALRHSAEAAHHFRLAGDRERLSRCRLDLGAAALYSDDPETASGRLQEALLLAFELRSREGVAWAEHLRALVDLRRGDHDRALRRLTTALGLFHELGVRWRQASVLDALAAALTGRAPILAAELLGTAEQIRADLAIPVPACERPALAGTTAALQTHLDAATLKAARTLGRWHQITHLRRHLSDLLG